ncbi:MAG: protein kinase domain-containing protein, partial [Gemmata sp.]
MNDEPLFSPRPEPTTDPRRTTAADTGPESVPYNETLAQSPEQVQRTAAAVGRVEVTGYEIIGELGRGGMGVVYKARHIKLNRIVALKMILAGGHANARDIARFVAEAEAVAAVRHQNVIQVYESGEAQGHPFMAMEFLEGGSLASRLRAGGKMGPRAAAEVMEKVARGVQAAHDRG